MSKNIVRPSTLPGFMELPPDQQILFNRIKDTIRRNYEKFGFLPIDTPIIERAEVLLAKGGGETEAQVYRFKKGRTDMALRFDLTVPLARYVAQHYSELNFPFKRYHIGKVYRGERSQRGRFREFYQCDIDIIGNGSLGVVNDAEIPAVIYSTFKELDFGPFVIKINNRKVLTGFFASLGIEDSVMVLRTIDKIEKIGPENVRQELAEQDIGQAAIDKIMEFIKIRGSNQEIIESLEKLEIDNPVFEEGLDELRTVIGYIEIFGVDSDYYQIDLTIARGLDYYTGTVYETTLVEYPEIGSVCSGGRYDDLASYYTTQKLPGVGISIGLTRLFYQLNEAKLIKEEKKSLTQVLIIPMDEDIYPHALKTSNILREEGLINQVYLEPGRMGRKFTYADRLSIPYVIVLGQDEIDKDLYSLRDMKTGQQDSLSLDQLIDRLKD